MANIQDIVFRPDGITIFLNDNTVVNGKYRTVDGQVKLVGVSSEMRLKCQAFYINRDVSADADIRYCIFGHQVCNILTNHSNLNHADSFC